MRTTIDKAGRIVVPKKLRDRLGLVAGTEVEIDEDGGGFRVEPVAESNEARIVDRDGVLVIEGRGFPVTSEELREMVEDLRDRR